MPAIKDKLYRLITEAKNTKWLKDETVARFCGATFINTEGAWGDCTEESLIIEIAAPEPLKIKQFARDICHYNEQESVLIQEIPCSYQFVSVEKKQYGGDDLYGL